MLLTKACSWEQGGFVLGRQLGVSDTDMSSVRRVMGMVYFTQRDIARYDTCDDEHRHGYYDFDIALDRPSQTVPAGSREVGKQGCFADRERNPTTTSKAKTPEPYGPSLKP